MANERALRILITCEHGGNRIPARYAALFHGHHRTLASHAGHDPGALVVARALARTVETQWPTRLVYSTTSRLLVDLNRSIGHPRLHGEPVRALHPAARRAIVERHYLPYRGEVERWVEAAIGAGARVLHVSCHTFTPRLNGAERNADVGLLFDPGRGRETALVQAWRDALRELDPELRVRFNYPYRGTSDGVTTALRRRYADAAYAGVELELNQAYPADAGAAWRALRRRVIDAFAIAVGEPGATDAPASAARRTGRARGRNAARVMSRSADSA